MLLHLPHILNIRWHPSALQHQTHLQGFGGTAEMMATLGCCRGGIRRAWCGCARHGPSTMFANFITGAAAAPTTHALQAAIMSTTFVFKMLRKAAEMFQSYPGDHQTCNRPRAGFHVPALHRPPAAAPLAMAACAGAARFGHRAGAVCGRRVVPIRHRRHVI